MSDKQLLNKKCKCARNKIDENIALELCQFYRDEISERTKRKMRQKASRGYLMGKAPLGYKATDVKGLYQIDELGECFRDVFKLVGKGKITPSEGISVLAYYVERKSGKKPSKRQLKILVSNPYYAGYIQWEGVQYQGRHEALVCPEEHDYLTRLLKEA